jgi:hypothetical protein
MPALKKPAAKVTTPKGAKPGTGKSQDKEPANTASLPIARGLDKKRKLSTVEQEDAERKQRIREAAPLP